MTTKDQTIAPCPFCGNAPRFSDVQATDERRYMAIELGCCVTMSASMNYERYRQLTPYAIKEELTQEVQAEWNQRAEPEPDCRTCTHHYDNKWCSSKVLCTNGNQYKEAPSVVLWRTQ